MLFNSIHFLVFYPVVVAIYFFLPFRFRWILLLLASCYFYMAFIPAYILILAFTIILDYYLALWIEGASGPKRRLFLIFSLVSNVGILIFFKYFNFLLDNTGAVYRFLFVSDLPVSPLNIVLPIGLSFHTFQSMGYIVEVYQGKIKAERHLGYYWVYVMFFPQLVAGPIERAHHLMTQFHREHKLLFENAEKGLKYIVYGFLMKLFVADRLSVFVDAMYDDPSGKSGADLLWATYFFSFQIYCDFAGYSNIAIGTAKILGIDLMKNFDRPYFSASVSEFWSRWHISLSSWFRDYVYIPLGGNRVSTFRHIRNLLIVFGLSGIWHGANWTFVVWGLCNGVYLASETLLRRYLKSEIFAKTAFRWIGVLITFHCVLFSWVYFRAKSIEIAHVILRRIWESASGAPLDLIVEFQKKAGIFAIVLFLLLETSFPIWERAKEGWKRHVDWIVAGIFIALILTGGVFYGSSFIYFQF
ncbi:MBOAT family O-acyltransferase [Leptospira ellisii]|uniref:MBOAT family O-acyltransferase n=1 Tax=Leptospira ellisii TaxID=2023197 RepID=A0A2N0BCU1_9LEPT|nr:MBOAT family O-acyltransferase [Leptospira ellisii]MDV6235995.1 MBOAT family O-acyltransferase [Leptospira ellisii]PJZ94271.1 membrane-bound O-acyltransferase family protein [Leptospira ellisii]PKA05557.1 membrane-bound O-acyltransferase family protein [Leptospira ellisii]